MRKRAALSSAIGFILIVSLFCAAQAGKVESVGPLTDSSVPEAIRQAVEGKGYRLTLDGSTPACELWIRKNIPVQTKKEVEGVAYPQLAESTLIAVIHFPQAAADFRGHNIPAGFYTLRYAIMPNDGNHLGAAPNRDFLLAIPAASDTNPAAAFKPEELVTMSARTTGTKHPSPLSLAETDSRPSTPTVSKDDQDHWIFSATTKLNSGDDLPIALVVKGTAQQ